MEKTLKNYGSYIFSGLFFLTIVIMFFPFGTLGVDNLKDYVPSGFNLIFGLYEHDYKIIGINILGIFLLIFLIALVILPFLYKFIKKYTYLVVGILGVISSILYFLLPVTTDFIQQVIKELYTNLPPYYIGGVLLSLISLFAFYKFYLDFKEN